MVVAVAELAGPVYCLAGALLRTAPGGSDHAVCFVSRLKKYVLSPLVAFCHTPASPPPPPVGAAPGAVAMVNVNANADGPSPAD